MRICGPRTRIFAVSHARAWKIVMGAAVSPVVQFVDVAKSYGPHVAVDGISLDIERGETVALVGPNGAGKTTSISLLLGLRAPDRGTVSVLGTFPRAAVAAGRVSAMLQRGDLPSGATVRDPVKLACAVYGRRRATASVIDGTGIGSFAGLRVEALSGGQR